MDWNDFAKRLTLELSRLPVTSFLIVQGPSGLPYAQAMRAEGVLDAEAVSSAFLPRPLAPRQERRLRSLGWEPPDEEERKNWWHQLTWRERGGRATAEHLEACALLAGLMVGAFRDVYGIESPLELVYQASKSGPEGGPLALPGLGIPLAVPESGNRSASGRTRRPSGSSLETALTEARERGDQRGYLELLARAVLYLPAPGDPGAAEHQFATAQFGDGTFVLAFTSPEAMDRSLQGQAVHHREASLSELSRRWPHPEWQLAVNPGLPSASYLDANALFEPEEPRKPAAPKPPAPTDVHVAGASTRTRARTRGVKPARDETAAAPAAPRPPQSPAPPRTEPRPPSAAPAASPAPTRPPGDVAVPPPPQRRPEAPAARPAPPARETVGDPRGVPVRGRGGAPTPSPTPSTSPNIPPSGPPKTPPGGVRATPVDPHGLPVVPGSRRRDAAETVPATPHAAPVAPPRASTPSPPPPSPPPPSPPAPVQDAPAVPRQEKPAAAQAKPAPAQSRPSAAPGVPQRGVTTDVPGAPAGPGRGQRTREQDIPVAGREPRRDAGDTREVPAASGRAPGEGVPKVVVMQKVVRPEHVPHYLEGGYDLVAGYVHRFHDVRELTTPGALIRGLGLIYEGSPFTPMSEEIHVIRWPAVKPPLFRRPLGGIDEWSMGIIPGGWVIEKAPFPGSGYAPGDGPAIPEFKIESQRLPHGAEMYRIAADGRERLVAGYDADLRRWLVKLPGGRGGRA